ncbi:Oidioi.mRNA.OKI2018_I69.chr2.g5368.t1.cds [Oikopleura dioica]|uniref:Oidioi.mRNA.OKI2018_I69.chr2.g5368.t1.cds n=1 Tax=Oikopleura dioica TaxID=34765 RepID=A0ABN7T4G4_OIKDI|nr:Oidioi.mRNA.OKI2018_I69.chr2.g5368.t1.cds [Oikopleura dioica]
MNSSISLEEPCISNVSREAIESFRYFGSTIAAFDIVVGTIGNLMTILAFYRCRALHTPYNVFIVNLSVIDLVTASLMMPFNLTAFVYFCCGYTSIVCLMAITFNRFVIIIHRDMYVTLFSKRNVTILVILSWLIAPAFMSPVLFKHNGHSIVSWNEDQFLCTFVRSEMTIWWLDYMLFCRIFFQFLPWIFMVICYSTIFVKVRQQEEQMATYKTANSTATKKPCIYDTEDSVFSEFRRKTIGERLKGIRATLRRTIRIKSANSTRQSKPQITTSSEPPSSQFPTSTVSHADSAATGKTLLAASDCLASPELSTENISSNFSKAASTITLPNTSKSTVTVAKSSSTHLLTPPVSSGPRNSHKKRADTKLLICSVTICSIFISLFLPSVILNLIQGCLDPRLHMAASNLTWLNSCVNPIVYAMMNTRFRKEYIKILSDAKRWLLRR